MILARGITASYLKLGVFLVDTWCLGIKDTYFRSLDAEDFEMMIESLDDTTPMASVDPSYAPKLLGDAAAWTASTGFSPHRDFAAVERLFGDVRADASDATFQFGREGKVLYVPGPRESPTQVRLRFGRLGRDLGTETLEFCATAGRTGRGVVAGSPETFAVVLPRVADREFVILYFRLSPIGLMPVRLDQAKAYHRARYYTREVAVR